jgi:phage baseplate assembly protein W
MSIHGSTLLHPVQPNQRGTLATTRSTDRKGKSEQQLLIEQSIMAIIETRQGERVMLPDYGIPDFVFDVMDAGFTARVAYFVSLQIVNYEPLVDKVRVTIGSLTEEGEFIPGFNESQQRAAFRIVYTERGSNTTRNLVFPTWQLLEGN